MRILLFDMDGVLLDPHAYHRALMDTVSQVGRILGYGDVRITGPDIAAFEAAGVSSEWDSAAICAALLLENLWQVYPTLILPGEPVKPLLPQQGIAPPDFQAFFCALSQTDPAEVPPLHRAEHLLLSGPTSRTWEQRRTLQGILRSARQIEGSLTHRIFQELVLGSSVFATTYDLPAALNTESYLLQYDLPTLSTRTRLRLIKWLQDSDHRAAIFTSRPSQPVGDPFCTPEAEMGAQSAGLDHLPIVGLGGLFWLSARYGRDPDCFRKPSMVHALAAMRVAVGGGVQEALEAAAVMFLDGQADSGWNDLSGAEIYVFEDTAGGLQSARRAQDTLVKNSVTPELSLYGITDSEPKRQALEAMGATVVPSLSVALDNLPGF